MWLLLLFGGLSLLGTSVATSVSPDVSPDITAGFVRNSSEVIQSQFATITDLRNQSDHIQSDLLGPVNSQNGVLTDAIHEAWSVLGGNSIIHQTLKQNADLMTSVATELAQVQQPALVDQLKNVQSLMLAEEQNARDVVQGELENATEYINTQSLGNYGLALANQTAVAIQNVSTPVRGLEINATKGLTESQNNTNLLLSKIRQNMPQMMARVALTENENSEIIGEETQLESQWLVGMIQNVTSNITQQVVNGTNQVIASINNTENGNEAQTFQWLNKTKNDLTNAVENERDTLYSGLNDLETSVNTIVSAMNASLASTTNMAQQLASVRENTQNKLSSVTDSKTYWLGQILPLVANLNASATALQQQANDAIANFPIALNASVAAGIGQLSAAADMASSILTSNLTDSFNRFVDNVNKQMNEMYDQIQVTLDNVSAVAENALLNMFPMQSSVDAHLAQMSDQTQQSLSDASTQLAQTEQSLVDRVNANFTNAENGLMAKLNSINNTAIGFSAGFVSKQNDLNSTIADTLSNFTDFVNTTVAEVNTSFSDGMSNFQKAIVPWPSVSAMDPAIPDSVSRANDSVNQVLYSINQVSPDSVFATAVGNWTTAYGDISQYPGNVSDSFNYLFSNARDNITTLLQQTMHDLPNNASYALNQVAAIENMIENNFWQFGNSTDFELQLLSNTTGNISNMADMSKSLLSSIQANRDAAYASRNDIINQFNSDTAALNYNMTSTITKQLRAFRANTNANIAQNISMTPWSNALSNVQTNVSNSLDYSDELGVFKAKTNSIQSDLNELSSDVDSFPDNVGNTLSAASDVVNSNNVPAMTSELQNGKMLASGTVKNVNDKISAWYTQAGAALDAKVNETQDSIVGDLSNQFGVTQQALTDYLNYINGSSSDILIQETSLDSATNAANIQLGAISKHDEKLYKLGAVAVDSLKKKDDQVLNSQLQVVTDLNKTIHDMREKSVDLSNSMNLLKLSHEQEFLTNLTNLAIWVQDRLHMLFDTASANYVSQSSILDAKNRTSNLRLDKTMNSSTKQMNDVVKQYVNQTDLDDLTFRVTQMNNSLTDAARSAHNKFQNDEIIKMETGNANSTTKFLNESHKLETLNGALRSIQSFLDSISNNIPDDVEQETLKKNEILKDEANKIQAYVYAHQQFNPLDLRNKFETLSKDTMSNVDNLIDQTPKSLARAVAAVRPAKDFSKEMDALDNKIDILKKRVTNFADSQLQRIPSKQRRTDMKP